MKKTMEKVFSFNQISYLKMEFYLILIGMTALEILGVTMVHKVMPGAGLILLPLYFFVLTGYLFFGAQIGFSLAFILPLSSWLIVGMPHGAMLFAVGLKCFALCGLLYFLPRIFSSFYLIFIFSFIGYQVFGFLVLFVMGFSGATIFNDISNGYPGLILQLAVGFISILMVQRKK